MGMIAVRVEYYTESPEKMIYTIWVDEEIMTAEQHQDPEVKAAAAQVLKSCLNIIDK